MLKSREASGESSSCSFIGISEEGSPLPLAKLLSSSESPDPLPSISGVRNELSLPGGLKFGVFCALGRGGVGGGTAVCTCDSSSTVLLIECDERSLSTVLFWGL